VRWNLRSGMGPIVDGMERRVFSLYILYSNLTVLYEAFFAYFFLLVEKKYVLDGRSTAKVPKIFER
jgi:hypothetical protein